jgi:DNA repair exonuclease SbcCD ATPase subunit
MLKYQKEIDRLERVQPALQYVVEHGQQGEVLADEALFRDNLHASSMSDIENRDLESWLKAVMAPLETQVKEHHLQLRRRLDSIKRIHRASGELEERLAELAAQEDALNAQVRFAGARGRRHRRDI